MIRAAQPEEIAPVCARIAAINPWKLLGINGDELVRGLQVDPLRRMLVYDNSSDGDHTDHADYADDVDDSNEMNRPTLISGAIILRERSAAELLCHRGFGPALAAQAGIDYPCEWTAIPDAGYIGSLAAFGGPGQGIGQRLIDAAHAHFARAGHRRVLLMVSHFNSGARRFYERNGYREIAFLDDCLMAGNREHLMQREL